MTDRDYSHLQGLLAVTLGAVYAGLAVAALRREGVHRTIPFAFGGLAVTFVTLAAPLQWTGHRITIAWAAESLILFEMGLRFHRPRLSAAGLALLVGVVCVLAVYALTTFADPEDFTTHWVRRTAAEPLLAPPAVRNRRGKIS